MSTYDKYIYNLLPYQEGNDADFEFDLSDNFPIAQVSNISFQARDAGGRLIMPEKLLSTGCITLNGLSVSIPFSAAEMKGKPGKHTYEIDFLNLAGDPFATIGGSFTINKEVNKR